MGGAREPARRVPSLTAVRDTARVQHKPRTSRGRATSGDTDSTRTPNTPSDTPPIEDTTTARCRTPTHRHLEEVPAPTRQPPRSAPRVTQSQGMCLPQPSPGNQSDDTCVKSGGGQMTIRGHSPTAHRRAPRGESVSAREDGRQRVKSERGLDLAPPRKRYRGHCNVTLTGRCNTYS